MDEKRLMKISQYFQQKLLCPSTKGKLQQNGQYYENIADPHLRYPIVEDIPILIDDHKSLFSVDDFVNRKNTTFNLNPVNPVKKFK